MYSRFLLAAMSILLFAQGAAFGRQAENLQPPQLVAPAEHTTILQNVESALCSRNTVAGFGYSIQFAWSPVQGATQYELLVEHSGSAAPALDRLTQQLSYEQQQCGAFVVDANLTQWQWRVRVRPESGDPGPWSETRHFEFAPCRLLDGTSCRAPAPGSGAAPGTGVSAQPDSNGIYRIGGDVSPPNVVEKVEPEYTDEARKACFSGAVLLSLVIDNQGVPRDIRVVQPLGMGLDDKAIEAVQKWRFKPGLKNGQPVAVRAQVSVNFRMLCKKT